MTVTTIVNYTYHVEIGPNLSVAIVLVAIAIGLTIFLVQVKG